MKQKHCFSVTLIGNQIFLSDNIIIFFPHMQTYMKSKQRNGENEGVGDFFREIAGEKDLNEENCGRHEADYVSVVYEFIFYQLF